MSSLRNPLLWAVFILYCFILSYTITCHELWADEFQSWNIAKASASFSDLIYNTRYEGHPPVWYIILWFVSKFTHNVTYIQLPQLIIACLVIFFILFFSPFSFIPRILIPFGYFFLFEYGVLSRNYAVGILPSFLICFIIKRNFKYKLLVYYALLFLMSNTHLLALLLAGSLHLYFLLWNIEQKKKISTIALHVFVGILIFLPSLYFIFPPADSSLNIHFWLNRAGIIDQIRLIYQAPLRAFIPVPAWWKYNFWNTEFLLEAQSGNAILKFINPLVLMMLLGLIFFVLKKNRKSLSMFITNLLMTFIVSIIFPLTYTRYVGFMFVGFIAAYWLYSYETPVSRINKWLFNLLLMIQLVAGFFIVVKDIQFPFSNSYRVSELKKEIPSNKKIVSDYWALNTLEAYLDKPFYCIELQKEMSFIKWDGEFTAMAHNSGPFTDGLKNLFKKEGISQVYMISTKSPENITELDDQLFKSFKVQLIDKREGAIEKGSNLYLYRISSF